MSFIGSLDQFDLSIILQRIESYKKTGLLTVKQGERLVELSFRQGRLLCIGPVRPDISLAGRLVQAGVISREAYQEAAHTIGSDLYREVGAALTLIDLGHVNQQSLYNWALSEATRVIEALIAWTDGEIYFEENQPPPGDRLLIALPVSSMLAVQPAEEHAQPLTVGASEAPSPAVAQQPAASGTDGIAHSSIANAPTMHGEEPVYSDDTITMTAFPAALFAAPDTERHTDALAKPAPATLLPPRPVVTPMAPARVDTLYMQPQMIVTPVDLSAYREQNPQVTFTPDQWRLFTRADGQTTLLVAAQELSMSPIQVRQVAGELVALGVIRLSLPAYGSGFREVNELSPVSREYIQAGLGNGIMTPGYATVSAQPWDAAQPSPDPRVRPSLPYPIETQSQWGNGGNGATFVLGNGWVVAPTNAQPSQPLSLNRYDERSRVYAKAG